MEPDRLVTPQTEEKDLARALGLPEQGAALYVKREDLHPYGSHKGRSIPVMIDLKASRGAREFVISSSGNAALAAMRYIREKNRSGAGLSLSVLVGKHIDPAKRMLLEAEAADAAISIRQEERPLQTLFAAVRDRKKESLRQSVDDEALLGYHALAQELEAIPGLAAIFIGSSSGTCAEALASYFAAEGKSVEIHIVQTTACFPLAEGFDAAPTEKEASLADAIVDKVAHRKGSLTALIRKTGGSGWIASNEDIERAERLLSSEAGVTASANGALALAGLIKALHSGRAFKGAIACIVTGR